MKTHSLPYNARLMTRAFSAFFALACLPAFAYVVDNFNAAKAGWTDTLNGGTVTTTANAFSIVTAAGVNKFTSSIKTGGTYTNTIPANHTLELRVKIIGNVLPSGSTDANGRVVLGFVPPMGLRVVTRLPRLS